eukprot:5457778-Amphidinium_carterae.1
MNFARGKRKRQDELKPRKNTAVLDMLLDTPFFTYRDEAMQSELSPQAGKTSPAHGSIWHRPNIYVPEDREVTIDHPAAGDETPARASMNPIVPRVDNVVILAGARGPK